VEQLKKQGDALNFLNQSFKHYKPIGALTEGIELLRMADWPEMEVARDGEGVVAHQGVVTAEGSGNGFAAAFIQAIAQHRHWERKVDTVPA